MTSGGHVRLPDGSVVVALSLARPASPSGVDASPRPRSGVRVLVRARNRARALTRVRNVGLRSVYLRGNTCPPTPDEITAVLHHPDGLVWRATPEDATEPWHPIRTLFAPATAPDTAPAPQRPEPAPWTAGRPGG